MNAFKIGLLLIGLTGVLVGCGGGGGQVVKVEVRISSASTSDIKHSQSSSALSNISSQDKVSSTNTSKSSVPASETTRSQESSSQSVSSQKESEVSSSTGSVQSQSSSSNSLSSVSSSSSSSSSSAPPLSCSFPLPDHDWAGLECENQARTQCVAGVWQAPLGGGETGAPLRVESAHFAAYWKDGTSITLEDAQAALNLLETVWDFYFSSAVQFPEPYCQSANKFKAAVHFDNDFPLWGGGWSRGANQYMGMWVGPAAAKDAWGLAHEFTHGLQSMTQGFGDCGGVGCWIYESHANWMPHQLFSNDVHCSEMLVNAPHLHYGNTRNRYCNWQFFEFIKDKYCPSAVNNMWSYQAPAGQRDPWQKLMLSQSWSLEDLNDRFGEWAMHNIVWDYKSPNGKDQGAVYRRAYGAINADAGAYSARHLRMTQLEPLSESWQSDRRFVSPYHWAPQRWGYNVVQLMPESGATSIKVTFRGVVQEGADSGWRWGLVTTNAAMTEAKYSSLVRGTDGELELCLSPGEQVFLVVVATPTRYQKITWESVSDGTAYPSIYRYPYMVELEGAWPKGFRDGVRDACPAGTQLHANGGGCATPSTPASVYVGPFAKVLGGQVTGNARIEDHATIVNGNVAGGRVGAMSVIGVSSHPHHGASRFDVRDSANVMGTFYPLGWFGQQQSVGGNAVLLGDLEFVAASKTAGSFYGLVSDAWQGVTQVNEVTIKPPYQWRP